MAIHFEADRNLDVISMGRISVDFVPDTYGSTTANHRYTKFLGGSPANTAVAMARQGIFFVPLVWILTALLGMPGLQMSQAVSDACTLACAIPIQLRVLRQMSAMPEGTLPSA